jgi:hypothetical protein
MKEIETGLQVLPCTVRDEPRSQSQFAVAGDGCFLRSAHLSPCIRGLLRLGLAIGVRSRALPACSKSLSAFESADASTGSELRLSV